jgi:hypothetical protein
VVGIPQAHSVLLLHETLSATERKCLVDKAHHEGLTLQRKFRT